MKIKKFSLNSKDQVIVKIVNEILNLFNIKITNEESIDYASFSVKNIVTENELNTKVKTEFIAVSLNGKSKYFIEENQVHSDENLKAGVRRLIKLNLYKVFSSFLSMPSAPWGILHGVRPTKIVHKFIDRNFSKEEIIERLKNDYAVSDRKANLITNLAFKQRSFLKTSSFRKVSVYIGIPFCLSKCLYCSFPSYVLPKKDILEGFLQTLKKDIMNAYESIKKHNLIVQSIYIGGGTPTSLPNEEFENLLELVHKNFFVSETIEFTVEAGRPDSVNSGKIASMVRYGVNRVSVNPQTMQEKTLQYIGRKHTTQDIIELFDNFRQAGMQNINMDVIIGLPGETVNDVEDTMQKIKGLNPDNLTVHTLALKKGSKLKLNVDTYQLPDDDTALKMFDVTEQYAKLMDMEPYYLYRQGYMRGNLENIGYSKAGAEGLYNIQIMEERQTIIGIGPSATTKVVDTENLTMETAFEPKDLITYMQNIDKYMQRRQELLQFLFG
ncbi:coproporphyrinogen dehydrogenase HemZ [Anaerosinus sp.]|uniref:coproporphyrinogen dehydrogenase HemZ n=1 Tax=Selenobaculum sp. TaxID=3074374 RepID=UPI0015AEEDE5